MMEALACLLFGGAIFGGGMLQSRQRMKGWQEAAAACGLQFVESSSALNRQLKARAGPVEVRIESSGQKERPTWIVARAPTPPDFHMVILRPEAPLRKVREIEIGDPPFDSAFVIQGPGLLVSALLDGETRRLMSRANGLCRMEVSDGELKAFLAADEQVPVVLPLLLDLVRRFGRPLDIRQRLVENAREDPAPGVRLHNLLLLLRELPKDPRTDEAIQAARSDPSPEVRLRIAKEMGFRDTLLALAKGLRVDTVSAEAVSLLGRGLPFERTRDILERALSGHHHQTARACLEAIGNGGDAAAVEVLAKVLEQGGAELAPAAARALGAIGSPAAEPSLIQALQRDDPDVRVAAATALGRAGTVAAVPALKEAVERSRLDRDLHRAARQAIAEIQSRAHGASPGQLSLAGAEAGQLSLAEAEAGELSIAEDPAGELSLPPEEHPA
ncbi:MAG: HEAT repeat domain-containing protein [Thermoanaerobaculia bacterium]